jgi:hypothetical protein
MHETRHLPEVLLRSELMFSPERTLKPTVERLAQRAKGRYVVVDLTDSPNFARIAHQAALECQRVSEVLHWALAYDIRPLGSRDRRHSSQVEIEL